MAGNLVPTNILDVANYVQQQGDKGRQQGLQNRFADLAGQAYSAAPAQQNALIGQAVGVDPQAGLQLGSQLGALNASRQATAKAAEVDHMKKLGGAARYMAQALKSNNPAQVEGAWQAVRPYLAEVSGKEPPLQWDSAMEPALYQAIAATGGDIAAGMPAGFQQFELTARAAGLQPGTPEYQQAAKIALGSEGRASSAGIGFQKITGADGRERIGRQNPRTGAFEVYNEQTGQFEPMGAGMIDPGAPAAMGGESMPQRMTPQQIMAQATQMANQGGPGANDAQARAWLQQQMEANGYAQQAPDNSGLAVSRSPEETAAATEAAKQRVGLEFLPQAEAIKTQAAIQQEQGKAQVKNTADVQKLNMERSRDARSTLALLDEAGKLLPNATGSDAGAVADRIAGSVGYSTPGAQATASLQTIAGQLTSKMPRMQGPQSDKDVLLYKQMAGDLANSSLPVATRQAALHTIRLLNEKYADSQAAQGGNQPQNSSRTLRYNPATGRIE